MLFYEPLFLFVFLPVVYSVYLMLRRWTAVPLGWVALASCCFYGWSEPIFFWLVALSSALDFALGNRIAAGKSAPWLSLGVLANLALLGVPKYSAFVTGEIANPVLTLFGNWTLPVPDIVLPIGVSFIVFEKITYLVDIHRGTSAPAASFGRYLFYVFFFPKLLAGPIVKYHDIEPQMRTRPALDLALVALGFERFAVGVVKKVAIADPAGEGADQIFSAVHAQVGQIDAWIGALLFCTQIYFDFSGYSDMAIGLAMMFGFRLRENFDFPYTSVGITEFWRRWHISLSTWIRDYLYIPLGGNRVPAWRSYANLVICFLVSGLWHGANWTFIAWGAYHGFFLVIERAFATRWLRSWPVWLGTLVTLLVTLHGWVLFRSETLAQASHMIATMYDWQFERNLGYVPVSTAIVTAVALLLSITGRFWWPRAARLAGKPGVRLLLRVALVLAFLYSLGRTLAIPFQPFLYFRF